MRNLRSIIPILFFFISITLIILYSRQLRAEAPLCQYTLHSTTSVFSQPTSDLNYGVGFLTGSNYGNTYDVYEIRPAPNVGTWFFRVSTGWIEVYDLDSNSSCAEYLHSLVTTVPTRTPNPISGTQFVAQTATAKALAPTATAVARATTSAQATLEHNLMGPYAAMGDFATTWSQSAEYCLNSEISSNVGWSGCWSDSTYRRFHPDALSSLLFGPSADAPLRGVPYSASATCVASGAYLDVQVRCYGFGRTLYFHSSATNPGVPYFELVDSP